MAFQSDWNGFSQSPPATWGEWDMNCCITESGVIFITQFWSYIKEEKYDFDLKQGTPEYLILSLVYPLLPSELHKINKLSLGSPTCAVHVRWICGQENTLFFPKLEV